MKTTARRSIALSTGVAAALAMAVAPAAAVPTECDQPGYIDLRNISSSTDRVPVESFDFTGPGTATAEVTETATESFTVSSSVSVGADALFASFQAEVGAEAQQSMSTSVGATMSNDLADGETWTPTYGFTTRTVTANVWECTGNQMVDRGRTTMTGPTGRGFW